MNEIIDKIVGNNLVFGGLLIFLGIILMILIVSIVRSAKKSRKIPIYEEDLEDRELEKVKEKNIIDKPEVKKNPKKKVEKKIEIELEDTEDLEEILEEEETSHEQEEVSESVEENEKTAEEEIIEEEMPEDSTEQKETETIYSDGEPEEIIDEGYSEERIAELENIDEDEIKERIDKEHEEAIEETMEEIDNEEMADILQNLKEAKEVRPEDVVRKFEQEQEAQSIISYQELVDVVKNRDKDFEDELESKPLATVSDFLPDVSKEMEEKDSDMSKLIAELGQPKVTSERELLESDSEKTESPLEEEDNDGVDTKTMVKEASKEEIPSDGKFKRTELISPVFGRIADAPEDSYPTVKKFSHDEKELIDKIELPEIEKDDTIEIEATDNESFEDISEELEEENSETLFEEIPNEEKLEKTSDLGMGDISKNEEFLKALKDFRDSL